MLEIDIRPAQTSDAADISQLIQGLSGEFLTSPDAPLPEAFSQSISPEGIAACIDHAPSCYLIARVSTGLIGAACMKPDHHLHHLFVATPYQRQGVATRLWQQLHRTVSAQHGQIEVCTVNASLAAVPVYARWGFLVVHEPVSRNGLRYQPMVLRHFEKR